MKKLILAAALVVGTTAAASAADLPTKAPMLAPAPIFSWSGFYVGLHVGGAWANQDGSTVSPVALNQAPTAVDLDTSGWLGGVHLGYNWQFAPSWVLGIEADISATDLGESATAANLFLNGLPVGSGGISYNRDLDWLATFRGRVGVLLTPTWLLYATGGVAWAGLDYSGTNAFAGGCPNCGILSSDDTETGYVLGAGIEGVFAGRWLARLEYLYYHFDGFSQGVNFVGTTTPATTYSFGDLNVHAVRAGLSYKF